MYKIIILPLFFLVFLISCSADYKKLSKENYIINNDFNQTLINAYKKNADFEALEMHDWNSAKLYSQKALRSFNGELIKPESISSWDIGQDNKSELIKAYDNLIAVYNDGLNNDPINLAVAIVSLDCWGEQQEEGWQIEHIERCKSNFLDSMHSLYDNLHKENISNNSETEKFQIVKKNNEKNIYFDFDLYLINKENALEIKKFLQNNKDSEFLLIGHTDTKGSKKYNYFLSKKRAYSVKKILLDFGIKSRKIKILGKGEENLAIFTPDDTRHPANRRVVILSSY